MSYSNKLKKNIHLYVHAHSNLILCGKSIFTPRVYGVSEDYASRYYPIANLCKDCVDKSPKLQMRLLLETDL